jgi:hypothetical protein
MQARESQVPEIAASTVLSGNNVIYLKRERVIRSWNAAVLASGVGSVPDLFRQPRIHCGEAEPSWVLRYTPAFDRTMVSRFPTWR